MRPKIIPTILVVLSINSCRPDGYTIKGNIRNLDDGNINLVDIYGSTIASSTVKDGKFTFKGQADTAFLAYISNGLGVTYPIDLPVLIENSVISVKGDASASSIDIKGTDANEAMVIYKKRKDALAPDDKDGYKALLQETFEGNSNNILGAMLISSLYNIVSDEELLEYCGRLAPEFSDIKTVAHYRNICRARVNTAPGMKFTDIEMGGTTASGTCDKTTKLSDVIASNKVTVLLFWASWGRKASKAIPELINGCNAFKDKGLTLYSICLDSNMAKVEQFRKEYGFFGHFFAEGHNKGNKATSLYGIETLPYAVIIAQNGTIIARGRETSDILPAIRELF